MVEKHDIMFENLHGLSPMGPIRGPENCDIKPNFLSMFFRWPRNYYNDNKNKKKRITSDVDNICLKKVIVIC